MTESKNKLLYPAIFKAFSDNTDGYGVEFPDLPECITEGRNLQEALELAKKICRVYKYNLNTSR